MVLSFSHAKKIPLNGMDCFLHVIMDCLGMDCFLHVIMDCFLKILLGYINGPKENFEEMVQNKIMGENAIAFRWTCLYCCSKRKQFKFDDTKVMN
jgi:hypothetical protein